MIHLVFYDAKCPLCQASVAKLLSLDRRALFGFAPLTGKIAKQELSGFLTHENTLVLLQNFQKPTQKTLIRGKAVCRIFWLLGGWWKVLGIFSFFPFGMNLIYRFIAKHRRKLIKTNRQLDVARYRDRFYE